MQVVEQHRIDRHDPRWQVIDEAMFASKNLYNAALYMMRYLFIGAAVYLSYEELDLIMQDEAPYRVLPAKVAQQVLKQVHQGWENYFAACAEWNKHPEKFTGHPRLPTYLDKHGRQTSEARSVPVKHRAGHQRRCERQLQHFAPVCACCVCSGHRVLYPVSPSLTTA